MAFCNGVTDILGLSAGKTWTDVRKELSNEQVKRIHELYGFLWPIETDIISLLPKPDGALRALYTGIVDPRVTSAASLTHYFDEIIIQNPFVNPNYIKPEYNPTKNPHQYKQQTLGNVLLLLNLAPFIDAGYINFIPDPCVFDSYLQKQMFSMAEERSETHRLVGNDRRIMESLSRDDFERSVRMLPKDQQRAQIHQAIPGLSDKQINEMLGYLDLKMQEDPFTSLQSDLYKDGGQLMMVNMTPNFEISLFLSQITGSLLLTDSNYRWSEITSAQNKESGMVIYNWNGVSKCINSLEYISSVNLEAILQLRRSQKLGKFRKVMRRIYSAIQENTGPPKIELTGILKQQLIEANAFSKKELGNAGQYSSSCKFHCIIPKGGIVHNNAQRMLLSCGIDDHLQNVPMAIFVDHV
jgi:hypothetical protein